MPARTLLRGGHIISMDPDIGDLPGGDVLIEDEEEIARRGLDTPFYTCEFDITLKPAMSAARA